MKLFYQNNYGQTVDFMEWPYRISESNLFDYGWGYESAWENCISRFKREIQEKNISVAVGACQRHDYEQALEQLYEVAEQDVLCRTPGRLYINDSYLLCYFFRSEKTEWHPGAKFLVNNFTIVAETGEWITEDIYEFKSGGKETGAEKRYPFRYAYRYAGGLKNAYVENKHFAPVNFKIIIYGFCVNPHVIIGGHRYQVNIVLEAGELLVIDSALRTVKKIMNNGTIVDAFHSREKSQSVFQKIASGRNRVGWPGTFDFDIILYEERSEPKWQL